MCFIIRTVQDNMKNVQSKSLLGFDLFIILRYQRENDILDESRKKTKRPKMLGDSKEINVHSFAEKKGIKEKIH